MNINRIRAEYARVITLVEPNNAQHLSIIQAMNPNGISQAEFDVLVEPFDEAGPFEDFVNIINEEVCKMLQARLEYLDNVLSRYKYKNGEAL